MKDILVKRDCCSAALASEIISRCDAAGWGESTTYGNDSDYRTSDFSPISLNPSMKDLDQKIFKIFNGVITELRSLYLEGSVSITQDEGYGVLRYQKGQYYKQHCDNAVENLRVLSLVMFLNDDFVGGGLHFPGKISL